MINEKLEVQEYLEGKNINKLCVYRICYMLAKWYKEQGLDNATIRTRIFEWANANKIYIEFNLNKLIYAAIEDRTPLRGNVDVFINESDIEEIRKRFDSKNTRMLALALLSYAKASNPHNGECSVSLLGISNWLNMNHSNVVNRHFRELIDFGYISKVEPKHKWKVNSRNEMMRIKFLIPFINSGSERITDNNIAAVFNKHF